MAEIRLYRKFYIFSYVGSGSTSQQLIDPYYLSATTKNVLSATTIETPTVIQESFGMYYVDLNPNFYTFSNTYDLNWYVNYVNGAPQRTLTTRFKVNPVNIGSSLEVEIFQYPIEYEII